MNHNNKKERKIAPNRLHNGIKLGGELINYGSFTLDIPMYVHQVFKYDDIANEVQKEAAILAKIMSNDSFSSNFSVNTQGHIITKNRLTKTEKVYYNVLTVQVSYNGPAIMVNDMYMKLNTIRNKLTGIIQSWKPKGYKNVKRLVINREPFDYTKLGNKTNELWQ